MHLNELESELIRQGIKETFRGQSWEQHCREWVYFNCILDLQTLRGRFSLPGCVKDHSHRGTHDGNEQGFVCTECKDGIMGLHPESGEGDVFR